MSNKKKQENQNNKTESKQWPSDKFLERSAIGSVALGAIALSCLIWQIIFLPPSEQSKQQIQGTTTVVQTFGTFAAGIILFLNFRVSNRNAETANKNTEIANKNAVIAESKLVTERFSKATEQLGDDNKIMVRLGAIYSLDRIAKDSSYDRLFVLQLLAAFVREHSKKRGVDETISFDIQEALTVIGTHNKDEDNKLNQRLDLAETNLQRVRLFKTDLSGADLSGADLSEADLNEAKLSGAYLSGAYLNEADLSGADLSGADLSGAYLNEADLSGAYLSGAYLNEADLNEAKLSGAYLNEADLSGADLSGAILYEAKNLTNVSSG